MTRTAHSATPPRDNEFEVTLFGPGYGESIVVHVGSGVWLVVDSCVDGVGNPRALQYLKNLGVQPAQDVKLIVATHWHDDHIRGISKLVDVCRSAHFCCASALRNEEFLTLVSAMERQYVAIDGSGLKEIHRVLNELQSSGRKPTFAFANRRLRSWGDSEVWSLSPSDAQFQRFLSSTTRLLPQHRQTKRRIPDVGANEAAVVLYVVAGNVAVLLGSDLERRGWVEILEGDTPTETKASLFKVAHHGSQGSHHVGVWNSLLESDPVAGLTPWRRGNRSLPSRRDAQRILSFTDHCYVSSRRSSPNSATMTKERTVSRSLRESNVVLHQVYVSDGSIRFRRPTSGVSGWTVDLFGSACHLRDFVS